MRRLGAAVLFALSLAVPAFGAIREEPVTYKDGATEMKGFIVYDDAVAGKRPGIVLVHEWWGITKHVHGEAGKFAAQGYTAFIADMFGDGFLQDVAIWENKVPIQNPLLCEEDGPVYQLRRWYEQFYVDVADIEPDMVARFEFEVDTSKANEFWHAEVEENLRIKALQDAGQEA